jgi:hypothetical protein
MVGTPMDVTVSELAIESFYPADAPTAAALGRTMDRLDARQLNHATLDRQSRSPRRSAHRPRQPLPPHPPLS